MKSASNLTSLASEAQLIYKQKCLDPSGALRTQSWMGDLGPDIIGSSTFASLSMLGTHDSGTSAMTGSSDTTGERSRALVASVAKQWARAQGENIYTQLTMGVRYLDLRLMPRKLTSTITEMWIVHSLFCTPHKTVLSEISRFLDENPTEVILVDYQRVLQAGEDEYLTDMGGFRLFLSELQIIAHRVIPTMAPDGSPFDLCSASMSAIWALPNPSARIFALVPPHFYSPAYGSLFNSLPPEYSGFERLFPSRDQYLDYQWYNETSCSAIRRHMVGSCKDRLLGRLQQMLPTRLKELGTMRTGTEETATANDLLPDTYFFLTPNQTYLSFDECKMCSTPGQDCVLIQSPTKGKGCLLSIEYLAKPKVEAGSSRTIATVALRASNGRYLSINDQLQFGLEDFIGPYERFILQFQDKDGVVISLWSKVKRRYVTCIGGMAVGLSEVATPSGEEPSPGDQERFTLLPVPANYKLPTGQALYLKTNHNTYLSIDDPSSASTSMPYNVLSHSSLGGCRPTHLLVLEPQGAMTVAIRSFDGYYLSLRPDGSFGLSLGVGPWEGFVMAGIDGDKVSLYSFSHKKFVTARPDGSVDGLASVPGAQESFIKIMPFAPDSPHSPSAAGKYQQLRTYFNTAVCLPNYSSGDQCNVQHTSATSLPTARVFIEPVLSNPHFPLSSAVAIRSHEGHYLSLSADKAFMFRVTMGPWELFDLQPHPNSHDLSSKDSESTGEWFTIFSLSHKVYLYADPRGGIYTSPDLFSESFPLNATAFCRSDPNLADYASLMLDEGSGAAQRAEAMPVVAPSHTEMALKWAPTSDKAYEGNVPSSVYITGAVVTPDENFIVNQTKKRGIEKLGNLIFGESKAVQGSQAALRKFSRVMNPIAVAYYKGIGTPYSSERKELMLATLDGLMPCTAHLARCRSCAELRRIAAQVLMAHWGSLCCCVRPAGWQDNSPSDPEHDYRYWWWAREVADDTGTSAPPRCLWCTTSCDRNVLQLDFVEEEGLMGAEVCIRANIMRSLARKAPGV